MQLHPKKIVFCFLLILNGLRAYTSSDVFSKYPNIYFVESGSYVGEGIQMALDAGFLNIYSIELSPQYYHSCCDRFQKQLNVNLFQGDSSVILPEVLKWIDEPATFWLDAHYSHGDTAKGNSNSPILLELECIGQHRIKTHTILIDDVRQFGTIDFDFVTLDDIVQKLLQINPNYQIKFEPGVIPGDVLVAFIEKDHQ